MKERILRRPEVEQMTGLGRSSLYDRIRRGTFPAPTSLGGRAVGWPLTSIETWIDERIKITEQKPEER